MAFIGAHQLGAGGQRRQLGCKARLLLDQRHGDHLETTLGTGTGQAHCKLAHLLSQWLPVAALLTGLQHTQPIGQANPNVFDGSRLVAQIEGFLPGIEDAYLGVRATKVHHQDLLVGQTGDANLLAELGYGLFIHFLDFGVFGDIRRLVGTGHVLVKVPGISLAHQIHAAHFAVYPNVIPLINTTHAIDDLGAAGAGHLVAAVDHCDVRALIQTDLQRQVQRVGSDQAARSGWIVRLVNQAEQHSLEVLLRILFRLPGPLAPGIQGDGTVIATQESGVEHVVHGVIFQFLDALLNQWLVPNLRHVAFGKIPADLLDDFARLDDVIGAGLMMSL